MCSLYCSNSASILIAFTFTKLTLFVSRYQGFQAANVTPSPTPNASGQKCKQAHVFFDSPDLAAVAKEALNGFTLKKGWVMTVAYI